MTVDVEDWYQVENLRAWFPPEQWGLQQPRVEKNTHRLLDLFDSYQHPITATFFVLGWVAKRFPGIVREIGERGHEIASHGNGHLLNHYMTEGDLREDLCRSKEILEQIIGKEVVGYRAPSFSINDMVLHVIEECGYRYDSSYNSFDKHGRYGRMTTKGLKKNGIAIRWNDSFNELPVSNINLGGQIIPWGGGGYFRFFPPGVFNYGVRYLLTKQDAYLFYLHPWEIDAGQPVVKEVKGAAGWRHYLNLDKTYHRLKKFIQSLKELEFMSCSQYLQSISVNALK